jgi:hypothetical protein
MTRRKKVEKKEDKKIQDSLCKACHMLASNKVLTKRLKRLKKRR